MLGERSPLRPLASMLAAGLLCAPFLQARPAAAGIIVVRPARAAYPNVQGGCHAHGGVRVEPCSVTFTPSSPGPATVTIRTPSGSGTVVATDNNCASRGIATVSPLGNDQYQITAGATMGHCVAHFKYFNSQGKKVGRAGVSITNEL